MKKLSLSFLLCLSGIITLAQVHLDQNGLKTTVTNLLIAEDASAKRFEILDIGFNSHHWQHGGVIIVELFENYYSNGYEKYIIEVGSGQGTEGSTPKITLVESFGFSHNAQLKLGTAVNMGTAFGGYANMSLPVYVDVKYYANYQAKITYLQQKVDVLTSFNMVKINTSPTGTSTTDFTAPTVNVNLQTAGNLMVDGTNNNYFMGNVGIGTTTPNEKLAVNGKIRAKEIKVEATNWPDYVFNETHQLIPLHELEQYIKLNKHLPDVPSAKIVETNGIDLGEMNKLLLKKNEELTLYLIEQNKQLLKLASDLKTLQAKVEKINN